MNGINQLKVLQQLDNSIQLNKNIAKLANFTFKIKSIISIRSVNLDISLGQITFYIVSVNTLFLFYLANINKHKTFFNNITNQMIQSQI